MNTLQSCIDVSRGILILRYNGRTRIKPINTRQSVIAIENDRRRMDVQFLQDMHAHGRIRRKGIVL